jgi:hypothetical protein
MFSRRAASEFPNDNPELHDGLVWQSESVTGHALPTLRLRPLPGKLPKVIGPGWTERHARDAERGPGPVKAEPRGEIPVPVPDVAAAVAPEPEPHDVPADTPPPSAFDALVAALVRVALDRGATRIAAELPALLAGGRTTPGMADSPRAKALLALGPAWRSALDGGDLAGCGEQPLDVWASELLATLVSLPGEREALRRALRRHGVAAFGMLVAA